MRKSKRQTIELTRQLMNKPKWWNESFAKYNQKRLHKWAAEQRASALRLPQPRLELSNPSLGDRLIMRELYSPYVIRSNVTGIATL